MDEIVPEAEQTAPIAPRSIEIVRDRTFVRFVADEAIFTDLGRDVEVAFMQYGPMFTLQTDHDEYEAVDSKSVMTEVARMRASYPALIKLVMSFLRDGVVTGKLKGDRITSSVEDWTKISNTENSKDKD